MAWLWPFSRRNNSAAERAFRAEAFGGVFQLQKPRALVFVDRDFARSLGKDAPELWSDDELDGELGRAPMSAPLEAHLQLTNRCDAGCQGCYTGASPSGSPGEWGLEQWKRAIDALADAGVFHLALGGGESAILPWLGDVAEHARARGLVPNLTTSGLAGLDDLLPIAGLFGQINVSMDGVGEGDDSSYAAVRGFDGFARADDAVVRLRKVKREIGINCVITRQNFGVLDELFRYAKKRRLNEIEILRFKPSGRGALSYELLRCTDQQHRSLWPTIKKLTAKHRVRVRLDCSYTPMLAYHDPGPDVMRKLAVYGCTGGDFLIGAKADGSMTACSFAAAPAGRPTVDKIGDYWNQAEAFGAFRDWQNAAEPCRSCEYVTLCRGGCRVVSAHVKKDLTAPDPECPRVVDASSGSGSTSSS